LWCCLPPHVPHSLASARSPCCELAHLTHQATLKVGHIK
jgi:hypothetical protein